MKKKRIIEICIFFMAVFLINGAIMMTVSANPVPPPELPQADDRQVKISIAEPYPDYAYYAVPLSDELQEYTQNICKDYGISYELVLGIMEVESDFNPNLFSGTNDSGIMQINAANHEWLTKALQITDFFDPYQNILAGVYLLAEISGKYDTPEEILMVYNCGPSGARRLWKQGVNKTKYTNKVMSAARKFEKKGGKTYAIL